jgi:hypothetical protein
MNLPKVASSAIVRGINRLPRSMAARGLKNNLLV